MAHITSLLIVVVIHKVPFVRQCPSTSCYPRPYPYTPMPAATTVRIVVSCDAERYFAVDVTGLRNASCIRERIFSKLNISNEQQNQYSIFQSEIGTYATGEALTDDVLLSLCRHYGDASGSLKFFVSPFRDRPSVYYQSPRTPEGWRPPRRRY
ncbi:hypothetical protein HGRIS_014345 [Hohenbuehelia grisea]|uniref:Uncharacterized protein n=1 Tax=Hohenbuehelia grisea TaxID=104357 RepID=A0ABR3JUK0_9AGAR